VLAGPGNPAGAYVQWLLETPPRSDGRVTDDTIAVPRVKDGTDLASRGILSGAIPPGTERVDRAFEIARCYSAGGIHASGAHIGRVASTARTVRR
jgi:hypothetical protein